MPPCNFTRISQHSTYLLWHIVEPQEVLLRASKLSKRAQKAYQGITHPYKRKEWLAARLAIKQLLAQGGYEYTELQKDAWGRPHLANSNLYVSIAHSFPFAFTALDQQRPIGVDIQLPSTQLKNVKEKFLNHEEIRDSGNNLEKLCIYWCAKEAIYKAQGGKNLSLKQDIHIKAFKKKVQGTVWGEVGPKLFLTHYNFYEDHVLAWSREAGVQEQIMSSQ